VDWRANALRRTLNFHHKAVGLPCRFCRKTSSGPTSATIAGTWNDSALARVKAASDIGAESLPLQTMIPAIGTKNGGYSNYWALVSHNQIHAIGAHWR